MQKMIQKHLKVQVDTALNGLIAYNKVKQNLMKSCCQTYFNYILMDIRMPVMDGFKASEKILSFHNEMKQSKGLKSMVQPLEIIIVSSYLNTDTESKAQSIGIQQLYSKPIREEQLD